MFLTFQFDLSASNRSTRFAQTSFSISDINKCVYLYNHTQYLM